MDRKKIKSTRVLIEIFLEESSDEDSSDETFSTVSANSDEEYYSFSSESLSSSSRQGSVEEIFTNDQITDNDNKTSEDGDTKIQTEEPTEMTTICREIILNILSWITEVGETETEQILTVELSHINGYSSETEYESTAETATTDDFNHLFSKKLQSIMIKLDGLKENINEIENQLKNNISIVSTDLTKEKSHIGGVICVNKFLNKMVIKEQKEIHYLENHIVCEEEQFENELVLVQRFEPSKPRKQSVSTIQRDVSDLMFYQDKKVQLEEKMLQLKKGIHYFEDQLSGKLSETEELDGEKSDEEMEGTTFDSHCRSIVGLEKMLDSLASDANEKVMLKPIKEIEESLKIMGQLNNNDDKQTDQLLNAVNNDIDDLIKKQNERSNSMNTVLKTISENVIKEKVVIEGKLSKLKASNKVLVGEITNLQKEKERLQEKYIKIEETFLKKLSYYRHYRIESTIKKIKQENPHLMKEELIKQITSKTYIFKEEIKELEKMICKLRNSHDNLTYYNKLDKIHSEKNHPHKPDGGAEEEPATTTVDHSTEAQQVTVADEANLISNDSDTSPPKKTVLPKRSNLRGPGIYSKCERDSSCSSSSTKTATTAGDGGAEEEPAATTVDHSTEAQQVTVADEANLISNDSDTSPPKKTGAESKVESKAISEDKVTERQSSESYPDNSTSGYDLDNSTSGYDPDNSTSGYDPDNSTSGYDPDNSTSGHDPDNSTSGYDSAPCQDSKSLFEVLPGYDPTTPRPDSSPPRVYAPDCDDASASDSGLTVSVARGWAYGGSSVLSDTGGNSKKPIWQMLGHSKPARKSPRQRALPPLQICLPAHPSNPYLKMTAMYGPSFRFRAPHIMYEDDPLPNIKAVLKSELAGDVNCLCSVVDIDMENVPLPIILTNPACKAMRHNTNEDEESSDIGHHSEFPDVVFQKDGSKLICFSGEDVDDEHYTEGEKRVNNITSSTQTQDDELNSEFYSILMGSADDLGPHDNGDDMSSDSGSIIFEVADEEMEETDEEMESDLRACAAEFTPPSALNTRQYDDSGDNTYQEIFEESSNGETTRADECYTGAGRSTGKIEIRDEMGNVLIPGEKVQKKKKYQDLYLDSTGQMMPKDPNNVLYLHALRNDTAYQQNLRSMAAVYDHGGHLMQPPAHLAASYQPPVAQGYPHYSGVPPSYNPMAAGYNPWPYPAQCGIMGYSRGYYAHPHLVQHGFAQHGGAVGYFANFYPTQGPIGYPPGLCHHHLYQPRNGIDDSQYGDYAVDYDTNPQIEAITTGSTLENYSSLRSNAGASGSTKAGSTYSTSKNGSNLKCDEGIEESTLANSSNVKLDAGTTATTSANGCDLKPGVSTTDLASASGSEIKPDTSTTDLASASGSEIKLDTSTTDLASASGSEIKPDTSTTDLASASDSEIKPDTSTTDPASASGSEIKPDTSITDLASASGSEIKPDTSTRDPASASGSEIKPDTSTTDLASASGSEIKLDASTTEPVSASSNNLNPDAGTTNPSPGNSTQCHPHKVNNSL